MGQKITGAMVKALTGKRNKAPKGAPRRKRPGGNGKPSRQKYWDRDVLLRRKVAHLVKYSGFPDWETAREFWLKARKGRRRMAKV